LGKENQWPTLETTHPHSDSPVGKPLSGDVANRQLAEHDLGARILDLLQLVVQNVPLGVDDFLPSI
jgi:hypothetical protein